MPIRDYLCLDCGHEMKDVFYIKTEDEPAECNHCESHKIERLPSLIGGYNGDLGSASTTPRSAGSRRRK